MRPKKNTIGLDEFYYRGEESDHGPSPSATFSVEAAVNDRAAWQSLSPRSQQLIPKTIVISRQVKPLSSLYDPLPTLVRELYHYGFPIVICTEDGLFMHSIENDVGEFAAGSLGMQGQEEDQAYDLEEKIDSKLKTIADSQEKLRNDQLEKLIDFDSGKHQEELVKLRVNHDHTLVLDVDTLKMYQQYQKDQAVLLGEVFDKQCIMCGSRLVYSKMGIVSGDIISLGFEQKVKLVREYLTRGNTYSTTKKLDRCYKAAEMMASCVRDLDKEKIYQLLKRLDPPFIADILNARDVRCLFQDMIKHLSVFDMEVLKSNVCLKWLGLNREMLKVLQINVEAIIRKSDESELIDWYTLNFGTEPNKRFGVRAHDYKLITGQGSQLDSTLLIEEGESLDAVPGLPIGKVEGMNYVVVTSCDFYKVVNQREDGSWPINSNVLNQLNCPVKVVCCLSNSPCFMVVDTIDRCYLHSYTQGKWSRAEFHSLSNVDSVYGISVRCNNELSQAEESFIAFGDSFQIFSKRGNEEHEQWERINLEKLSMTICKDDEGGYYLLLSGPEASDAGYIKYTVQMLKDFFQYNNPTADKIRTCFSEGAMNQYGLHAVRHSAELATNLLIQDLSLDECLLTETTLLAVMSHGGVVASKIIASPKYQFFVEWLTKNVFDGQFFSLDDEIILSLSEKHYQKIADEDALLLLRSDVTTGGSPESQVTDSWELSSYDLFEASFKCLIDLYDSGKLKSFEYLLKHSSSTLVRSSDSYWKILGKILVKQKSLCQRVCIHWRMCGFNSLLVDVALLYESGEYAIQLLHSHGNSEDSFVLKEGEIQLLLTYANLEQVESRVLTDIARSVMGGSTAEGEKLLSRNIYQLNRKRIVFLLDNVLRKNILFISPESIHVSMSRQFWLGIDTNRRPPEKSKLIVQGIDYHKPSFICLSEFYGTTDSFVLGRIKKIYKYWFHSVLCGDRARVSRLETTQALNQLFNFSRFGSLTLHDAKGLIAWHLKWNSRISDPFAADCSLWLFRVVSPALKNVIFMSGDVAMISLYLYCYPQEMKAFLRSDEGKSYLLETSEADMGYFFAAEANMRDYLMAIINAMAAARPHKKLYCYNALLEYLIKRNDKQLLLDAMKKMDVLPKYFDVSRCLEQLPEVSFEYLVKVMTIVVEKRGGVRVNDVFKIIIQFDSRTDVVIYLLSLPLSKGRDSNAVREKFALRTLTKIACGVYNARSHSRLNLDKLRNQSSLGQPFEVSLGGVVLQLTLPIRDDEMERIICLTNSESIAEIILNSQNLTYLFQYENLKKVSQTEESIRSRVAASISEIEKLCADNNIKLSCCKFLRSNLFIGMEHDSHLTEDERSFDPSNLVTNESKHDDNEPATSLSGESLPDSVYMREWGYSNVDVNEQYDGNKGTLNYNRIFTIIDFDHRKKDKLQRLMRMRVSSVFEYNSESRSLTEIKGSTVQSGGEYTRQRQSEITSDGVIHVELTGWNHLREFKPGFYQIPCFDEGQFYSVIEGGEVFHDNLGRCFFKPAKNNSTGKLTISIPSETMPVIDVDTYESIISDRGLLSSIDESVKSAINHYFKHQYKMDDARDLPCRIRGNKLIKKLSSLNANVRYVSNSSHVFLMLLDPKTSRWYKLDLGGGGVAEKVYRNQLELGDAGKDSDVQESDVESKSSSRVSRRVLNMIRRVQTTYGDITIMLVDLIPIVEGYESHHWLKRRFSIPQNSIITSLKGLIQNNSTGVVTLEDLMTALDQGGNKVSKNYLELFCQQLLGDSFKATTGTDKVVGHIARSFKIIHRVSKNRAKGTVVRPTADSDYYHGESKTAEDLLLPELKRTNSTHKSSHKEMPSGESALEKEHRKKVLSAIKVQSIWRRSLQRPKLNLQRIKRIKRLYQRMQQHKIRQWDLSLDEGFPNDLPGGDARLLFIHREPERMMNYLIYHYRESLVFCIDETYSMTLPKHSVYVSADEVKLEPRNALQRFLAQARQDLSKPCFLIVNWHVLNPRVRLSLNTVIDDRNRMISNEPLPENVQVVGVAKTLSRDPSFITRQDVRIQVDGNCVLPPKSDSVVSDVLTVDFSLYANWRDAFFGRIVLEGSELVWDKSDLMQYLTASPSTSFKIALLHCVPSDQKEINSFLERSKAQGYFEFFGYRVMFPGSCVCEFVDSKNVFVPDGIAQRLKIQYADYNSSYEVINTDWFNRLIIDTQVQDGQYLEIPGLVEKYKDQSLSIYLTDSLSAGQWNLLLKYIHQYGVKLNCFLADHVDFPEELKHFFERERLQDDGGERKQGEEGVVKVYVTNNAVLTTRHHLSNVDRESGLTIIDIDDESYSSLVGAVDYQIKDCHFTEFDCVSSDLIGALSSGETVILRGRFSASLLNCLQPIIASGYFLINQQQVKITGKLCLIVEYESQNGFDDVMQRLSWLPSPPVRIAHDNKAIEAVQKAETVCVDVIADADGSEDETKTSSTYSQSELSATQFITRRIDALKTSLSQYQGVGLIGATGVGKSRLMEHLLEPDKDLTYCVYYGLESIPTWAEQGDMNPDRTHVLFIDESNLVDSNLTLFANLFDDEVASKKIFYRHKLYSVAQSCKVVFACNPQSYGGGRFKQKLFSSYAVKRLQLDEFPSHYLYHHILAPLYSGQEKGEFKSRCQTLIERYQAESEMNIRHLQHQLIMEMSSNVRKSHSLLPPGSVANYDRLTRFLCYKDLQRSRQLPPRAGLSGVLIEGEPATGKSFLVEHALLLHFSNADEVDQTGIKPWIKVGVGIDLKELELTLINAFHNGQIVWIDEINSVSSSGIELVLNSLLCGQDPLGNIAKQAGFGVIATANSAALEGRDILSPALQARYALLKQPTLSRDDMRYILEEQVSDDELREDIVFMSVIYDVSLRELVSQLDLLKDVDTSSDLSRDPSSLFDPGSRGS